jgi:hypothetical protein
MKRTTKPQQIVEKIGTNPSRGTRSELAVSELAEFIRLANLVPEGAWLPPELLPNLNTNPATWVELSDKLHQLPDSVRAELVEQSNQVQPTSEQLTWASLDTWRFAKVLSHYEKIRIAYYNLRGLLRKDSSLDSLESLLHALLYAKLVFLRRCGYEKCGKIFYASRQVQPGCTPAHSSIIRKIRKRENDKRNQQKKRDDKKKRASKR